MPLVDNFSHFVHLRKRFPEFSFESFNFDYKNNVIRAEYCFKLGDTYQFHPVIQIVPGNSVQVTHIPENDLSNMVFNAGMIEMISYWKATCSPNVIIKPKGLSDNAVEWWKSLFFRGLGEFFYLNGIQTDRAQFMHIAASKDYLTPFRYSQLSEQSVLIPIGGGKDSPVTLELHRKNGYRVTPLIINPRGATIHTVTASGLSMDDAVIVNRSIDPLLLKLNQDGFLNGHTPFSAMLAFYSLIAARLCGIYDIALSNESSANESTVSGSDVNHQYSKSFQFESDFREYTRSYISEDFNYFSMLRPINELQIAALFSGMETYHSVFRSCNVGSKTDSWCGQCPKCLFAALILSPFIPPERLKQLIGTDILNNMDLLQPFHELTGAVPVKPFECVGTIEEVNHAISLSIRRFYSGTEIPLLFRQWTEYDQYKAKDDRNLLLDWNELHYLSIEREKILKQCLSNLEN